MSLVDLSPIFAFFNVNTKNRPLSRPSHEPFSIQRIFHPSPHILCVHAGIAILSSLAQILGVFPSPNTTFFQGLDMGSCSLWGRSHIEVMSRSG